MTSFLQYTHNLNILIVDENENIIEDKILLESIYNQIADKVIIKQGKAFNIDIEIKLYWKRLSLTKTQSKFIGELFIISAYSDMILYETTKKILNEIENNVKINTTNKNWKIIFHISKLSEENKFILTIN